MDINKIESIHRQYENYMEDYELLGSYSVFIPFFKTNMRMKYLYESELNIIEDFICRCIERGIKERKQIVNVLALDNEIFSYSIQPLLDNNYISKKASKKDEEIFDFTELGSKLIERKTKYEPRITDIEWFFDGLNSEYKLEFFSKENEHLFRKYDDITKDPNSIVIFPKIFPSYEKSRDYQGLSKRILSVIEDVKHEEGEAILSKRIVNIDDFELLRDREVFYHEYRVVLYKNSENSTKLLAHDPCGSNFIDQRVTETIKNLFVEGKFNELISEENKESSSMTDILLALKNYAISEVEVLETEEAEDTIAEIEELEEEKISSSYIMNYRIRELFLEYLKNAKDSIFIISPWMNNYIINSEFKEDILNLLKRGVKVRIICGITDENDINQDKRDINTQKIAKELMEVAKPYGDLFKLKFGRTHEKLLICDRKHYINGSFNFLSYSGENDKFFRNEGSTYSEDENLINQTIKLRFKF